VVTDAILRVLGAFATFLIGLMGTWELPDWLSTVVTFVANLVTQAAALGNWIPWQHVGIALALIWASFLIAFGVRVARIVASFFTAGGGSAA